MPNTLEQLFDPRGVASASDLCPCGEPRQINSLYCVDCLLEDQEQDDERDAER
mgnify:CR=1 FL=1